MNLNLKGKIGRLPEAIREEVNVRLWRGETGRALVEWLNGLPEVRAILAAEFGGKPVREQNVSEWRRGGHQRWLRLQEAYTMMERIGKDVEALNGLAKEPVTATLATWVTAQYVVAAKSGDQAVAWNQMREFCHDVLALQRGEQQWQRLDLERQRLDFGREKARVGLAVRLMEGRMGGEHSTPNIQHSTPNVRPPVEGQGASLDTAPIFVSRANKQPPLPSHSPPFHGGEGVRCRRVRGQHQDAPDTKDQAAKV